MAGAATGSTGGIRRGEIAAWGTGSGGIYILPSSQNPATQYFLNAEGRSRCPICEFFEKKKKLEEPNVNWKRDGF